MTGIYQIRSKIKSERFYIGSAINIQGRWNTHLYNLRKNKHNPKLQNHFNKYGESDLQFMILELCFPEFLTAREQYYINKMKPWFNISIMANSPLGNKYTKETKRKMSESHKGVKKSDETKRKMSNAKKGQPSWNKGNKGFLKGRKLSEETKQKLSKSHKGFKHSEETKRKISISHKNRNYHKISE